MLAPDKLSWGLCIATLNRIDALETSLRCAIAQSRQPVEVIVVDASSNWEEHGERCAALFEGTGIRFVYLQAPQKSSAIQRNHGISSASADICFLIDDDSFMYPDCAEQIMQIYEHPACQNVLAVSASDGEPFSLGKKEMPRKNSPLRTGKFKRFLKWKLFRFVWREILMMSAEKVFVPYAGPYQRAIPQEILSSKLDISNTTLIAGYKITVRRAIAQELRFDENLQSYSPAEDLDFSYRVSRRGYLLRATNAKLYHHEIAASRIKRKTALLLSITNVAYFVRKNSKSPRKGQLAFGIMLSRRLLAEIIKDSGARRWRFENFRGALDAIPISVEIFRQDIKTLPDWYREKQLQILSSSQSPLTQTSLVKN